MTKENELEYFYQVSDDVPRDVISCVTSGCDSEKCFLSARVSSTTLAGASKHYDKYGDIIYEDKNRIKVILHCIECSKGFEVAGDSVNGFKILREEDYSDRDN